MGTPPTSPGPTSGQLAFNTYNQPCIYNRYTAKNRRFFEESLDKSLGVESEKIQDDFLYELGNKVLFSENFTPEVSHLKLKQ